MGEYLLLAAEHHHIPSDDEVVRISQFIAISPYRKNDEAKSMIQQTILEPVEARRKAANNARAAHNATMAEMYARHEEENRITAVHKRNPLFYITTLTDRAQYIDKLLDAFVDHKIGSGASDFPGYKEAFTAFKKNSSDAYKTMLSVLQSDDYKGLIDNYKSNDGYLTVLIMLMAASAAGKAITFSANDGTTKQLQITGLENDSQLRDILKKLQNRPAEGGRRRRTHRKKRRTHRKKRRHTRVRK